MCSPAGCLPVQQGVIPDPNQVMTGRVIKYHIVGSLGGSTADGGSSIKKEIEQTI